MAKTLDAAYRANLGSLNPTITTCVLLTRQDGTQFGFTIWDQAITRGAVTYSPLGALSLSARESETGLNVDNSEFEALFEQAGVTEADIKAGFWDHSKMLVFDVDYLDPNGVVNIQLSGYLGVLNHGEDSVTMEFRSLSSLTQQVIGERFTKKCRYNLGDARCGVNLALFTVTGTVTAVSTRRMFNIDTVPLRGGGLITFTSGANDLLFQQVRGLDTGLGIVQTRFPFPFNIQIGDTYSVYAGCDFIVGTCNDVFDNVINFGGFPDIPGNDSIYDYPDARI